MVFCPLLLYGHSWIVCWDVESDPFLCIRVMFGPAPRGFCMRVDAFRVGCDVLGHVDKSCHCGFLGLHFVLSDQVS